MANIRNRNQNTKIRTSALDLRSEELALKYLTQNRGRAIYEPTGKLSKFAAKVVGAPKNPNAQRLQTLKLRWREIVGDNLANICAPEAIRAKTLVLRANGAATPLLHMRANEIMGLAALACGAHFAKLSFVQAPLRAKPTPKPKPLDAAAMQAFESKLAKVQSEGLKNALRQFNAAVQSRA